MLLKIRCQVINFVVKKIMMAVQYFIKKFLL